PSPITTTPRIATLSRTKRIASTAAWSASSLSPRPIQRAAAIAAASVTRTSSSAMLRSGACLALTRADPKSLVLHPLRRLDSHEIEAAGNDRPRRTAKAEPESLLLALEHAVLVEEAREVAGARDRRGGAPLWPALRKRLLDDSRQLGEPLH